MSMKKFAKIKENIFLIEPMRYVSALRKNLWIVAVCVAVFAGIGIGIAKTKETKYWSATAKVIRYDKKISMPKDIPYQFQNFNYETALETIRTRANLVKLIKELKLDTTPEALFSRFEIKRGRNSDIIEVIFTDSDKELSAKGANVLSQIFINNFYTIQNAAIEKIYGYYEKNKKVRLENLELAKKKITVYLKKNKLVSLDSELEMEYAQLKKLQLQRLQNQTEIDAIRTAIVEINASLDTLPDKVQLRYTVRSANTKDLEEAYRKLTKLKTVYTEAHPEIKMIRKEIALLKDANKRAKAKSNVPYEVTYENNPVKSQMNIELSKKKIAYATAKNSDMVLKKQIDGLKKRIAELSNLKKGFDKLVMQKEDAERQLALVSKRLHNLKMTIGSSKEDFKFFEKAKVPMFPKPTYKKVIVIMLTILGFVLSIIIIVAREFLDDSIKTKFDLSERFGIAETVQLPKGKNLSDASQQRFSYLADNIIGKTVEGSHLIIAGSDQRKSMNNQSVIMLLDQLAHQKKKTLFVKTVTNKDASHAEATFSLSTPPSSEALMAEEYKGTIDKAYWHLEENYSIFIPDNESVSKLFEELKGLDYDYVVIETPSYEETEHLMPKLIEQCDTFLLLTTFGLSSRKVIHQMMKRIEESTIDKLKGVINATDKYFLS